MDLRYQVFASFAAAAMLFRWEPAIFFLTDRMSNVTWSGWPGVFCAFAVLSKPSDVRRLLAMYAATALDVFVIAPEVPNHYLLTCFVGLAVWATALAGWARRGALPTGGELVADLGGPVRVGTAVFYLFTGIWKSNDGFVDPAFSCGALSWARLVGQFPFLPDGTGVRYLVMAFTLVLEYLGPVLLLVPATRTAMAVGFFGFHAVLSLDVEQNYQNFSWAMTPLLSLFLPDDTWTRFAERVPRAADVGRWLRLNVVFGHAALIAVAFASSFSIANYHFQPHWVARWLAATVSYQVVGLGVAWSAWAVRGSRAATAGGPAAWLFLALVVLNGLSPVIGFKNRNAWQMYSNVRIEAHASNHWFLPPSLDLFGLEGDVVEILEANDAILLRQTRDQGLAMTWWDFRVYLADNPGTKVRYRRGGEVYELSSPSDLPDPPPWLLRKVVWFRPVGEAVARQCQW